MTMHPEASPASPAGVLAFWRDAGATKWYTHDPAFDAEVRARFLPTYEAAKTAQLAAWDASVEGALALCILLDQFPRNMFRGTAQAFATDPLALRIASRAIERGFDQEAVWPEQQFFYLPFMHSEDLHDQERCVEFARATGDANMAKFAEIHADIIRRFGRFPHRNAVLGRQTTAEEQAFLDGGGFAG